MYLGSRVERGVTWQDEVSLYERNVYLGAEWSVA